MSDVARSKIDMLFAVGWGEILEQFNLGPAGSFDNGERNLRAGHTGDFAGHFASLMGTMRKLEAENIAPESERALEIRHRDTGVIRRHDVKWCLAHLLFPICLNGLFRRRILRRGRGDPPSPRLRRGRREFLKARIVAKRIEHWIEPEERGSERHVFSQRTLARYRE